MTLKIRTCWKDEATRSQTLDIFFIKYRLGKNEGSVIFFLSSIKIVDSMMKAVGIDSKKNRVEGKKDLVNYRIAHQRNGAARDSSHQAITHS